MARLSRRFPFFYTLFVEVLRPRVCRNKRGLGYFHFARHYFGNRGFFLFLRLLRCFSSAGWLHINYGTGSTTGGLSHSDICGSIPFGGSPQLFAAVHVLLRLSEPRHPPCALILFISCLASLWFHIYIYIYSAKELLSHFKYVNDRRNCPHRGASSLPHARSGECGI